MKKPSDEKRENARLILRQGALYIFVGATSAILELGLFQFFVSSGLFGIEISNITAIVLSTVYNFALNGRITFRTQANKLLCFAKYMALFLFNMAFTTIAISYLSSLGIEPLIAKVATMCCVVAWNFVLYRKFVFA